MGVEEQPSWRAALWLRRHRVLGRSGFVWRIVVARLAASVAALATLLRAATEPFTWVHFMAHVVANSLAALLGGYVGGRILWALVVSRGGRTR